MQRGNLSWLFVVGVLMGFILVSCTAVSGTAVVQETPTDAISCEGLSISNPAASYCTMLGYESGVQDTPDGQAGICTMSDGTVCDEWQFLRGKCGAEFSWCAMNGMGIQTVTESDGSATMEYAVCVDTNGTIVGKVTELSGLQTLLDTCTRH